MPSIGASRGCVLPPRVRLAGDGSGPARVGALQALRHGHGWVETKINMLRKEDHDHKGR